MADFAGDALGNVESGRTPFRVDVVGMAVQAKIGFVRFPDVQIPGNKPGPVRLQDLVSLGVLVLFESGEVLVLLDGAIGDWKRTSVATGRGTGKCSQHGGPLFSPGCLSKLLGDGKDREAERSQQNQRTERDSTHPHGSSSDIKGHNSPPGDSAGLPTRCNSSENCRGLNSSSVSWSCRIRISISGSELPVEERKEP